MAKGKKLSVKLTKEYKALWLEVLPMGNGFDYLARRILEHDIEYEHISIKWRYYVDEVWCHDEEFVRAVRQIKYDVRTSVENELVKKCHAGDTQAIKFYLERLMSDKYMEKKSHDVNQNVNIIEPVKIIIEKPNDKSNK